MRRKLPVQLSTSLRPASRMCDVFSNRVLLRSSDVEPRAVAVAFVDAACFSDSLNSNGTYTMKMELTSSIKF